MCTEIYVFNLFSIKTMLTCFGQNTAESYDNYIFLTRIYIFWPEFGLKPRYFALHLTVNGNVLLNIAPPLDTKYLSICSCIIILKCNQHLISKGGG